MSFLYLVYRLNFNSTSRFYFNILIEVYVIKICYIDNQVIRGFNAQETKFLISN